jgi:predicted DNA-binding ribbon-helix-helix protein
MKKKLVTIGFLEKGVVLEGLDEKGQEFADVIICCQHMLKHKIEEVDFVEKKHPQEYKRKVDIYEMRNSSNGGNRFWWELRDHHDNQIVSSDALDIHSLDDLLLSVLRNQVRDVELSEKTRVKYNQYLAEVDDSDEEKMEEEISSLFKKLLEG